MKAWDRRYQRETADPRCMNADGAAEVNRGQLGVGIGGKARDDRPCGATCGRHWT